MRWSLIALAIATACGDNGVKPDAAVADADAPVDAHVPMFGAVTTLSDPTNQSFVPVIATRGTHVVVAWHDFPVGGNTSRVLTRTITDGVVGAIEIIPETLGAPKRPTIATTTAGFVLAWDATDTGGTLIRTIDLDADGHAIGSPTTVSSPGAAMPRVTARGDDVVWAWTTGTAHYVARRGPVETLPETPVGSTLLSTGILNFPRVALTSTGELLVAYRDGGPNGIDWDVLLMVRQVGGAFLGPLNVSRSTDLLSDDIGLAVEADDTIDIVWVDQDPFNVNAFEVEYARRTPGTPPSLSAPATFGTQGLWAWTPSVTPGLATAWYTGAGAYGDLWLTTGATAEEHVLLGEQGSATGLAKSDDGAYHLVYQSSGTPHEIRYAVRR